MRVDEGEGDAVYYIHSDHLGSTSLVTDEDGQVVARQIHDPFGEVRWAEGSPHTDYGYAGQRYDAGSALLFLHARHYDPALGRFISADTIVPEPGNPQSFNRYSYVYNNSLRYTDPSGHRICKDGNCEDPEVPDGWPYKHSTAAATSSATTLSTGLVQMCQARYYPQDSPYYALHSSQSAVSPGI
jgi:RHS repeat-associated protein